MLFSNSTEIVHYMCAKFHFVDLAGSERAHKTGNVGDRFKGMFHFASQSKLFDVSSDQCLVMSNISVNYFRSAARYS